VPQAASVSAISGASGMSLMRKRRIGVFPTG
jgi:hypothetical protein